MKRVLIIPAILATAFTAAIAEGQTDSAAQVTDMQKMYMESLTHTKTEDVLFVDQNELKISDDSSINNSSIKFSNLYGYKSITDAEQEKNGQVIGLICDCSSFPKNVTSWGSSNIVSSIIAYNKECDKYFSKRFVFYKEECAKENWIIKQRDLLSTSNKPSFDPKFNLLINFDFDNFNKLGLVLKGCTGTKLEHVFSGNHGFDRNGYKASMQDFETQLKFVLKTDPMEYILGFWPSKNDRVLVKFAKDLAKKLLSKDSFSNAEKVAIYIAVEIIVDA